MPFLSLLNVNALFVEYPGYGLYQDAKGTRERLLSDANMVYEYLTNLLEIPEKNILLMGNSLGCSVVNNIAGKNEPLGVINMSPFASVKEILKDKYGVLSWFFDEYLNNEEFVKKIKCPYLIIHGERDTMIPGHHSEILIEACGSQKKMRVRPKDMDHTNFDIKEDIYENVASWMEKFEIKEKKVQEGNEENLNEEKLDIVGIIKNGSFELIDN